MQTRDLPRINNVFTLKAQGPWTTKSGGELKARFEFPNAFLGYFFSYNQEELSKIPMDLRGFRIYTVEKVSKGNIGGTEFHRIRKEIVLGLEGAFEWECEDLFGSKLIIRITPENGILIPPFLLHTYKSLKRNSALLVVANTLFDAAWPATHDTYPLEEFRRLQKIAPNTKNR